MLAKQGWGAWPVCSRKAGAVGEPSTQRSAPAQQVRLSAPAATGGDYVVKRGDTLSTIASARGVAGGWKELVKKNPALSGNPDNLSVGQRLTV